MSKELPTPEKSEEVDLGQLFKLIGNAFDKLFKFIGRISKAIFSVFIYAFRAVIVNFKIIAISMIIAGIAGYGIEKLKQDIYVSQMLVKPYFDSKYQLVTNINYYNALIDDKDYNQLQNIFKIDEISSKKLIQFEIVPGPETENDRIKQYDSFLKSIDSTRAQEIDFETYIDNRSIYSGDIFEINVKSYQKDIFRSLEPGLNTTFTNTYSMKKMQKRDSLIQIEKSRILRSLNQVDSLQKVYVKVMQQEANSNNGAGTVTLKEGMSLVQERIKTKEYELLEKQLELRQTLSKLESQKVEEDVYFDTISSFQDVGSKHESIWDKYSIVFPVLVFVLLSIVYLVVRFVKFVKSYEG